MLFSAIGGLGRLNELHAGVLLICSFTGFLLLIVTDIPGINFWGLFMAAAGCYVCPTSSDNIARMPC